MFKRPILVCIILLSFYNTIFAEQPHFAKDPAISPDGKTVCFSYMSDLWLVQFEGGEAKRITVSNGDDYSPVFSPDGKQIAFNSNRDAQRNVYTIPAEGGKASCVCKEGLYVCDWFSSGKKLLATGHEVGLGTNFFSIPLDEMRATEITSVGGFYSKLSKDNKKILFCKEGYPYREAYSGSRNGDLWEYDVKTKKYAKLTNTDYTERYPVYSSTKDRIYFAASDGKVFQLYYVENYDFENKIQLTNFKKWSVRDISIAKENDRIVFEKFDEIWKYDPKKKKTEKIKIEIKQDFIENFQVKEEFTNKVNNFNVSPDGKLIVFSYKFDLFAVPEKGGEVRQITFDQSGVENIQIMSDNQTIFFTKYEKGKLQLFMVDIKNLDEIKKIKWFEDKYIEWIEFGNAENLIVHFSDEDARCKLAKMNYKTEEIEILIDDQIVYSDFVWSQDDRYGLYFVLKEGIWNRNLYLYDFETDEKRPLFPYHGWMGNITWGKKGEFVFFNQGRNICRLELLAKNDFWDEKNHWKPIIEGEEKREEKDENEEETEKEEKIKPIKIDFENIDKRVFTLVSKSGYNIIVAPISDSLIYYLNEFEDEYTLRKIDYKGKKDEDVYMFFSEPEHLIFNEENDCFYFVENETLKKLSLNKECEIVKNEFKYNYDKLELNRSVFEQAWTIFGKNFYDPEMHGQDWDELFKRFYPYMDFAYTSEVMANIVSEMIGELNASHTGFYPKKEGGTKQYEKAYVGFIPDYSDVPKEGIRFKKIFRKSKLNMPYEIKNEDILLSVDGVNITSKTAIAPLFLDKVGDKIKLEIQIKDSIKIVEVKGLSWRENYNMYYDNWVSERKEIVDNLTDNRIGYAHIRQMGSSSYNNFVQDIFAKNYDKDALIIDIRNNSGGWIHDKLIELLTRKTYAYTTSRIFNARKQKFPSNSWEKPIILLINENSFSDAEIFPILFKQLKLGKIIGMPTSGSVIGTTSHRFMDGSSMRMPRTGWYTPEDINMEGTGAQPDIYIDISPEQKIIDDDVQLKMAVKELLKKIE